MWYKEFSAIFKHHLKKKLSMEIINYVLFFSLLTEITDTIEITPIFTFQP
ncbi:hypothetical protein LCGC14_1661730 [marine sediment metagenome]|uniref:Uncharacterized protein n=1 Tax=marine sediment metagenome TaxID=412755 RepID=A0A0F9HTW7_9ZZZZ